MFAPGASKESSRVGLKRRGDQFTHQQKLPASPPPCFLDPRRRPSCQAPGCRHVNFVDLHHVETREDGGAHEADNLVTLCGAHHRAVHRGELIVQGRVSTGLSFRHADGTEYGGVVSAPDAGTQAVAFQALRRLGFGEGETRRVLSQVLTHMGNEPNLERVLRSALDQLSAHKFSRAS